MIPGQDLQASEGDLLQTIGRYYVLFELEQKRRAALLQAYNELQSKYDALTEVPVKGARPDAPEDEETQQP